MSASFGSTPIDDVDRAILQLLQRDARNLTAVDIAGQIDVSDGTVRNRIEKLEERGIIEGYAPTIDYERAGYQLQVRIMCTADIVDRERLAREALQVLGVVEVHEIMTGRLNVEIKAVAPSHENLSRVTKALDELGLTVETQELISHHYLRPFDHFGAEDVSEEGESGDVGDDDAVHEM